MTNELEKECIQFTEDILRRYRELRLHLEKLKRIKESLKCEYTEKAITYDKVKVSPTNKISKEVEDEVIRTIEKINAIQRELNSVNSLKRKIDIAISNLRPIHKDIIELKLIKGLDWQDIVDKTNYSERSLIYKKNEAVRSIAVALFGTNVFNQEDPTLFDMIDL